VGITRAKKELIVTWNTGRQGDTTPSLALSALMGLWEQGDSNPDPHGIGRKDIKVKKYLFVDIAYPKPYNESTF
jgi:hypothetical protein